MNYEAFWISWIAFLSPAYNSFSEYFVLQTEVWYEKEKQGSSQILKAATGQSREGDIASIFG